MTNLIEKGNSFYVAGHNGMVGKAIIKELLKKGYCDRKYGGKLIKATRNELDLTCFKDVSEWFRKNKPDIVIVAAAKVGGIYANYTYPYEFISENLKIAQNIIEAAWKNETKRLLFLGSSCIYPKSSKCPIREEDLLSSNLEKTNESYAIAKIAGIKLCEAIRKQYGFDTISLMPTNLYGPGDNYHSEESHVIASLLKKFIVAKRNNLKEVVCWGTGNPLREFLHVDDLASSCIYVLEKWNPSDANAPKDTYGENLLYLNVGSGEEISIKDLAKKIADLIEYKGDILWDNRKPDGTPRKILNCKKLERLGWKSTISLEEGILKTFESFEKEQII